jgi:hypothetical protein
MLDLSDDVLADRWWTKAMLVTDYLARKLMAKVYEHKFQFNLALLDYDTSEHTFKLHEEQAEMARNSVISKLLPWVSVGPQDKREIVADMRRRYLQRFADPQSEKGKAAIARQLAKWGKKHDIRG